MPDVGGIAGDRLRSFIERVERLEEEKRALNQDIKEVYGEAKGTGFDTRIMRQLVKERRMDKDDLDEQQTLLDVYRRALGMLVDTPLGEAAIERAAKPKARSFKEKVGDKLDEIFKGTDVTVERDGTIGGRPKRAPRRTGKPILIPVAEGATVQ